MALSEREKRVLAEMERELFGASTIEPKLQPANNVSRLVVGILIAVIGLSVLLFAAIAGLIWFGVVGFGVTLVGVLMASATPRDKGGAAQTNKAKPQKSGGSGSFFGDRWDRREGQ